MKKILIIVLLMAIPFQYSWAAAARYCTHEKGTVSHFGHHTHQHKAQLAKSDNSDESRKATTDCESCQLFSHAAAISIASYSVPLFKDRHVRAAGTHYASHIADSPPGPDWTLVA